jgi:hypothetical protein
MALTSSRTHLSLREPTRKANLLIPLCYGVRFATVFLLHALPALNHYSRYRGDALFSVVTHFGTFTAFGCWI